MVRCAVGGWCRQGGPTPANEVSAPIRNNLARVEPAAKYRNASIDIELRMLLAESMQVPEEGVAQVVRELARVAAEELSGVRPVEGLDRRTPESIAAVGGEARRDAETPE